MDRLWRFGSTAALLWFVGCGGEGSDPVAVTGEGRKVITAMVDGEAFVSDHVFATWPDGALMVRARSGNRVLTIHSTEIHGPGAYVMATDPDAPTSGGFSYDEDHAFWTGGGSGEEGILTLTTATSTHLTGTFAFVGYLYSWDYPPPAPDSVRVEHGFLDIAMP